MAKYLNYRYLYPPRPSNAISPEDLIYYDNDSMLSQPKINGSNCVLFTNGDKIVVMNRHGQRLTNFQISDTEIKSLYRGDGKWMVLNAEYLNKSKTDENNQIFNHKFVIFDILVIGGDYLVGRTFSERIEILANLYGQNESEKDYLYSISENIYRVKSYESNFSDTFSKLTEGNQLMEGLVLKRKDARLEIAGSKINNTRSQVKCRVGTKNYKY